MYEKATETPELTSVSTITRAKDLSAVLRLRLTECATSVHIRTCLHERKAQRCQGRARAVLGRGLYALYLLGQSHFFASRIHLARRSVALLLGAVAMRLCYV
jgi:hypothetical protein